MVNCFVISYIYLDVSYLWSIGSLTVVCLLLSHSLMTYQGIQSQEEPCVVTTTEKYKVLFTHCISDLRLSQLYFIKLKQDGDLNIKFDLSYTIFYV